MRDLGKRRDRAERPHCDLPQTADLHYQRVRQTQTEGLAVFIRRQRPERQDRHRVDLRKSTRRVPVPKRGENHQDRGDAEYCRNRYVSVRRGQQRPVVAFFVELDGQTVDGAFLEDRFPERLCDLVYVGRETVTVLWKSLD